MGVTIDAALTCRALKMAWQQRMPDSGLIFLTDRGSQYATGRYEELLRGHGIKASIVEEATVGTTSARRRCSETLRVERPHGERCKVHRGGKDAVLDWLLWYNRVRMHTTLGYQSPTQFEYEAEAQHALAA